MCVVCGDVDEQYDTGGGHNVVGRSSQRVPLRMAAGTQFPLHGAVSAGTLERPGRQAVEEQPCRQRPEREIRRGKYLSVKSTLTTI